MKKRVLFIPSWYPSDDNPISGVFIQEQAHALSREFDVAVLIPGMAAWRNVTKSSAPDRSNRSADGPVPVYREFALPLVPHGPESVDYQTFARAAENGFKKVLKEFGRPDVIHAHVVLPAGWSALKLGQRHAIPVVLTEHSSPFSMHLDTQFKRTLVKETLNGVSQVVAISPALKEKLLAFDPQIGIKVIGELVSTDFFVPSLNGTKPDLQAPVKFFVVARLAEQKGLTHLLRAVQLLQQSEARAFELWLGGDGPDRQALEQFARELGIAERCQFLGQLNRGQVRDWLQKSDVFVLSSLHETFGVVVGEAMACGKPTIVTRCGGPEFIVTDETGLLVDVASPEALANAMSRFMRGEISFDSGAIRDSVVNRFGVDAFLRNISEVYDSVQA
jgi:glycosyltransferase involved in cell wall biosynthesis